MAHTNTAAPATPSATPEAPEAAAASIASATTAPTGSVPVHDRTVHFVIHCAPLDNNNPMYDHVHPHDHSKWAITNSASYLTGLPYALVDADTQRVISPPPANSHKDYLVVPGKSTTNALHDGTRYVHELGTLHIPDDVRRIALHIANDAFHSRRHFQLFPWTVPNTPGTRHSTVHIYELRSDLKSRFFSPETNDLPRPPNNTLVAKPGSKNEYYGCLDGDLWREFSHEFTDSDITHLCPPETITRTISGHTENLAVNWLTTLAPIYAEGVDSRSIAAFNVQIPNLGITLTFEAKALINAIYTSNDTTTQQGLRRTSPRAFAVLLKAAWRLRIDRITLSSSWRPMLSSRLHKMGNALDVVYIDDTADHVEMTINNHHSVIHGSHLPDNHPFPPSPGAQELKKLYDELISDHEAVPNAIYTPWMNWVPPHDDHMHITAKEEEE